MKKFDIKEGDVVQLRPDHKFGGMLLVCTEPKSFGCQGYLMSEKEHVQAVRFRGIAYLRANFDEFEYVVKIHWIAKGTS